MYWSKKYFLIIAGIWPAKKMQGKTITRVLLYFSRTAAGCRSYKPRLFSRGT